MDENTRINELNITDEFIKVWSISKVKVIAQNLRKLHEGGVVLVTKECGMLRSTTQPSASAAPGIASSP